MKATIVSTDTIVTVKDAVGNDAQARVWEGMSENGIPFVAYVTLVLVATALVQEEFERELKEVKKPSPATQRAIDARFISETE